MLNDPQRNASPKKASSSRKPSSVESARCVRSRLRGEREQWRLHFSSLSVAAEFAALRGQLLAMVRSGQSDQQALASAWVACFPGLLAGGLKEWVHLAHWAQTQVPMQQTQTQSLPAQREDPPLPSKARIHNTVPAPISPETVGGAASGGERTQAATKGAEHSTSASPWLSTQQALDQASRPVLLGPWLQREDEQKADGKGEGQAGTETDASTTGFEQKPESLRRRKGDRWVFKPNGHWLLDALLFGDMESFRWLLRQGVNPNATFRLEPKARWGGGLKRCQKHAQQAQKEKEKEKEQEQHKSGPWSGIEEGHPEALSVHSPPPEGRLQSDPPVVPRTVLRQPPSPRLGVWSYCESLSWICKDEESIQEAGLEGSKQDVGEAMESLMAVALAHGLNPLARTFNGRYRMSDFYGRTFRPGSAWKKRSVMINAFAQKKSNPRLARVAAGMERELLDWQSPLRDWIAPGGRTRSTMGAEASSPAENAKGSKPRRL